MPGITTPYNLQMPSAGLIGRGSGAGRSTIMDAAAVRTLTDTLTTAEIGSAISAVVGNYLPLSGGTMTGALSLGSNALTCGSITTSGTLTLQNSTTAVLAEISKTFTSSTDREYLGIGYNSGLTGYFIGSRVGSAGGSARDLKLGHLAANGTTFVGLTVETSGYLKVIGGTLASPGIRFATDNSSGIYQDTGGVIRFSIGGTKRVMSLTSNGQTQLSTTSTAAAPVISFDAAQTTGLYSTTSGEFGITCGGVSRAVITSTGAAFSVPVKAPAATTAYASLNIPSGTAPTSPTNGDIWSDGSDLKVRLGGVTYTLTKV